MMRKIALVILFLLLSTPAFSTDWCSHANIIACYRFDPEADKLKDNSANTHDLSVNDAPTYQTSGCHENNCYEFDGSNDVLYASDHNDFTPANLTACGWFNTDTAPGNHLTEGVISHYNKNSQRSWALNITEVGASEIYLVGTVSNNGNYNGDYAVEGATQISTSTWYHACLVFDASAEVEIFLNGSSEGTAASAPASLHNSTYHITLGHQYENIANSEAIFDGHLDEFGIFGVDLDTTDINDIMDNGLSGAATEELIIILTKHNEKVQQENGG